MSILNRKLEREIIQSKGLLAAIIAITIIGGACFVSMIATYKNLESARDDYYSRCRMADFWIDLKKSPITETDRIKTVEGVSEIQERISFPVVVDLDGVDKPISGQVISMPTEPTPVLCGIVMKRGSYFTADRRDEVIISEKFAQVRRIAPGMFIHLILNEQRKKLFVVGTAISSEYAYLTPPGGIVPEPLNYGVFYIKRDLAEDMFGFQGACNNLVGMFTPDARRNPEPVLREIERRLDPYGVFAATPLKQQASNLALTGELKGLAVTATILPVVFLGVAALVLNVLMTRMAEQQRTTVGTLKALGYTNGQIFAHFVKFGLFVGIVGGVLGCAMGYWLTGWMVNLYSEFYEFPRLVNDIYPMVLLISLLISIAFSVLGTLRGVHEVVKLNPAEAMRERPPAWGGQILLEHWRWFWTRLDFRWQMVFRGLFRHKVRTIIGLTAAAMGSAIVLLALGNTDSLNYMVVLQFEKVLLSDFDLSFKDEVGEGALDEAKRLPGIMCAEPICYAACTFRNGNHAKKGGITGIAPEARMTVPRNARGDAVCVPSAGLLMVRRLAEQLHLAEGDTVRFTPVKGLRVEREAPVAKIIDSAFGLGVYADFEYLSRLIGEVSAISKVQLKAQQTAEERAEFYRRLKEYPKLQSVSDIPEQRTMMEADFIAKLKVVTVVMIGFAAVIFFGSILNASLISIAERQREIATFRVLGYDPMEIGAIFLRENMLVNIFGAIGGLPVGYGILYVMIWQYENDMYVMPCVVNGFSWMLTVILAAVFVLVSHVVVQRVINRLNWSQALAMKE
ncbi:MAG: FtsX-like permease family protein [Planctomycetota bacterium]